MADLFKRFSPVRVLWFAAALAGFAAAGCGQDGFDYGANGTGPGRRHQQVALSAQQEVQLGNEAFAEVKKKESDHFHMEGPQYDRVKNIGDKIFQAALHNEPLRREIGLSDADPYGTPWVFDPVYAVVDSNEVNAFCLPAGKVVVFTGLMDLTKGKDAWLATVLGHEIAHAVAHHASERVAREQMYGQASDATSGLQQLKGDDRWKLLDLLGVGSHVEQYAREQPQESGRPGLFAQLGDLKFDRQQEEEADHIGVFFMAFAGETGQGASSKGPTYDPEQAVAFWQAMEEHSGSQKPPEILSDHPSDQHRIEMMRGWAARARAAHDAWQQGNVVK